MQVRRIDTLDLIALLRLHKFVVDEEPNGLVVFAAIGRCEGDEEVGHIAYYAPSALSIYPTSNPSGSLNGASGGEQRWNMKLQVVAGQVSVEVLVLDRYLTAPQSHRHLPLSPPHQDLAPPLSTLRTRYISSTALDCATWDC